MTSGQRWAQVWRGGAYLLGSLTTGIATVLALPLLVHPGLARQWADWHRDRAGRLLDLPVAPRPAPRATPRHPWADPAVRRDLLWLPLNAATGVAFGLAVLLCVGNALFAAVTTTLWWTFGQDDRLRLFLEIPVTGWTAALTLGPLQILMLTGVMYLGSPPIARAHARICLAVLSPSAAELADRVAVLTRTRADVLDAHGAELRRIERDLHDGTQARLVATAMRLAVARQALSELLTRRATDPIAALTPREREVLALMAQGHDNATIGHKLVITDNAVHKHIGNIFAKLGLAATDSGHRRVLAVLTYLNGMNQTNGD